jgi:hypothetical protein
LVNKPQRSNIARTWTSWALPLLLGTITCAPLDVISMEETSTTTVPKASIFEQLIGDIGFGAFLNIDIVDNTQLRNQGVKRHQIDSVYATSFTLTITSPASGQDFSFIDSLQFYVNAENLPQMRIASGSDFPLGAKELELSLDPVDLAPYAAAESMTITSDVEGRRPIEETDIEAKILLEIDLNIGGLVCGPPSDSES